MFFRGRVLLRPGSRFTKQPWIRHIRSRLCFGLHSPPDLEQPVVTIVEQVVKTLVLRERIEAGDGGVMETTILVVEAQALAAGLCSCYEELEQVIVIEAQGVLNEGVNVLK